MLKQKHVGLPPRKEAAVAPPSTVDLMDALRRSVQAERPGENKGKKVNRQSGKRKTG